MSILDNFKNPWANNEENNIANTDYDTIGEINSWATSALKTDLFEGNDEVLGIMSENLNDYEEKSMGLELYSWKNSSNPYGGGEDFEAHTGNDYFPSEQNFAEVEKLKIAITKFKEDDLPKVLLFFAAIPGLNLFFDYDNVLSNRNLSSLLKLTLAAAATGSYNYAKDMDAILKNIGTAGNLVNYLTSSNGYKSVFEMPDSFNQIVAKVEKVKQNISVNRDKIINRITLNKGNVYKLPEQRYSKYYDRFDSGLQEQLVTHAFMGGTQGSELILNSYTIQAPRSREKPNAFNWKLFLNKFEANFSLNIYDDFGINHSDILKPTHSFAKMGLIAFWILQHQRGFTPFSTKATVNFNVYVEYE